MLTYYNEAIKPMNDDLGIRIGNDDTAHIVEALEYLAQCIEDYGNTQPLPNQALREAYTTALTAQVSYLRQCLRLAGIQ
jgi:hypothetical protein